MEYPHLPVPEGEQETSFCALVPSPHLGEGWGEGIH